MGLGVDYNDKMSGSQRRLVLGLLAFGCLLLLASLFLMRRKKQPAPPTQQQQPPQQQPPQQQPPQQQPPQQPPPQQQPPRLQPTTAWSIVKLKLTWTSSGSAFKEVYFFRNNTDKVVVSVTDSSNGIFERVLDPPLQAVEIKMIHKDNAKNGTATVELELVDTDTGPLRDSFPVGRSVSFVFPNRRAILPQVDWRW